MSEWIDQFLPYERDLFFALNGSDSLFVDNLMWTITGRFVWIPLILFLLYMTFRKTSWKEALLVILFLILTVTLCDQISSSIFKPMFHRFRPTHHPDFEQLVDIVRGYKGGRYGFISSHAANSFGLAVFLLLVFRQRWAVGALLFWAFANSYSRIYLGVHFISDILAGMVVGTLVAFLMYFIYRAVRCKVFKIACEERKTSQAYTPLHSKMIAWGIAIYIALIVVLSPFLANLPH